MSESEKTSWIYCNECNGTTRHALVASKEYNNAPRTGELELSAWGEYILWACAGCDTCTLEDRYTAEYLAEWVDGQEAPKQIYESVYHPKRASSSRRQKHFFKFPAKLEALYSEIIRAMNDNLHLLCAAGLRSLLEGVCAEKGIKGANLEKKIEGLKSLLPESIVKNLHEFRFIGNKAVHELEAPKHYELRIALDVIEDILNFLYALDYNASLLGKMRANRTDRAKEASTDSATTLTERGPSKPSEK